MKASDSCKIQVLDLKLGFLPAEYGGRIVTCQDNIQRQFWPVDFRLMKSKKKFY
jgi:hypothetical protein